MAIEWDPHARVVVSEDEVSGDDEWDVVVDRAREQEALARVREEERVCAVMAGMPIFQGERGSTVMELPTKEGLRQRKVYSRQVPYLAGGRVNIEGGVPVFNGLEYWMDPEESSVKERLARNLAAARLGEKAGEGAAFEREMGTLIAKGAVPHLCCAGGRLSATSPQLESAADLLASGATFIGSRRWMEDVICVGAQLEGGVVYSAVYDGHGGRDCALATAAHHGRFISRRLAEMQEYGLAGRHWALKVATVDLTRCYPGKAGTTVCSVVEFPDGQLACANLGDSRAFLVAERGEVVQLSDPQTPTKYASGVIKRGRGIYLGRVGGVLATARAVGNRYLTSGRSKVTMIDRAGLEGELRRPLEAEERVFVVIVSDGVTEVASTEQLGRFVAAQIAKGYPLERVAADVVRTAFNAESQDNLSCVVRQTRLGV